MDLNFRDAFRYWAARKRDLPWISDPDLEVGGPRWPDSGSLDWASVADAITYAADSLPSLLPDEDGWTTVVIPGGGTFGRAERRVLTDWGRGAGLCPRMNPGDERLQDGRHRLWKCWEARPEAVLLISSDAVANVEETDEGPRFLAAAREELATLQQRLRDTSVLDRELPVNGAFLQRIDERLR